MKGAEFKRRIEKVAKENKLACSWDAAHGKGSHGTRHLGDKRITLKDLKKEIGPGLLKSMCDDLGVDPRKWTCKK